MMKKMMVSCMVLLLAASCSMTFDYGKKPVDFVVTGDRNGFVSAQWIRKPFNTDTSVFRYTTDGTEPKEDSLELTEGVVLRNGVTVKVKAFQSMPSKDASATVEFVTDGTRVTEAPVLRTERTEDGKVKITLEKSGENDLVFYGKGETSSLAWSPERAIYEDSFTVPAGSKVSFSALRDGMFSDEVSFSAMAETDAPVITWSYEGAKIYALVTHLPGAEMRYTLDGTEPDGSSALVEGKVLVALGSTIKVKASYMGTESLTAEAEAQYREVPKPDVELSSNLTGWYVDIRSTAPQTVVRWTRDGSEPTVDSPLLNTEATTPVNSDETLRFAAFSSQGLKSPTLEIKVPGGPLIVEDGHTPGSYILIADGWDEIYYTTDGTDPRTSFTSLRYLDAVYVGCGKTIKAIAWKDSEYSAVSEKTREKSSEGGVK